MADAYNTQDLEVRSFFGATIKEALQQAHQELGPDALLLNAREGSPETLHLGAYEVILSIARPSTEDAASAPEELPQTVPVEDSAPASGAITEDLDALKTFMRTLGTPAYNSMVEESLIDWGIEPQMAHEIDQAVRQRINRRPVTEITRSSARRNWNQESLAAETTAEIAERLEVRPGIGRATALVGPPGMGKTTTLVKLAVVEGLRLHRSVRLISADTQRIGGAEQLRTFAAILGVPFQAVESIPALALAIDAAPPGEVLLIDTPGCSHAPRRQFDCDLAAFLEHRQDIDTHLVLTASTYIPVLRKLIDTYRAWGPSRLLFTKVDEAESLASVFCEAVRWRMPLSYFGLGQEIPEDLEAANKERVAESLVRRLPCDLQAVS